jgi:periplasmic protein TonB
MDWRFCHPLCRQQLNLTGLIGLTAGRKKINSALGTARPNPGEPPKVSGRGAAPFMPRRRDSVAPSTSGGKMPKVGTALQSLETLWPAESKRLGEEGTVLATIWISASGCVTGVSIAGSSGSDMTDTAVRSYLESVEFLPAELNGTAVESVATLPVVFKLDQNVAAPAFGQR